MMAIPAIDLREGDCVQLVGGNYERERLRLPDPVEVARRWGEMGFKRLHLIDLDAATGRGSNQDTVDMIIASEVLPVQVGGGVRSEAAVARLLATGADKVIVGTRAVEDPDWLSAVAGRHPGRLIVAADVRGRKVVVRGWQSTLEKDVVDLLEELNKLPLGGVMVTAVHKEGQMAGTDLPLMEEVARASRFPIHASGGVTTVEELRELASRGVAGAIIGMALYTGVLDPKVVAQEFST